MCVISFLVFYNFQSLLGGLGRSVGRSVGEAFRPPLPPSLPRSLAPPKEIGSCRSPKKKSHTYNTNREGLLLLPRTLHHPATNQLPVGYQPLTNQLPINYHSATSQLPTSYLLATSRLATSYQPVTNQLPVSPGGPPVPSRE